MVQVGSRLSPSQPAPAVSGPAEPQAKGNASAAPRDASGLQRKSDFTATFDRHGDINPHTLAQPISPNTLFAGSVIAASFVPVFNSDLPWLVTAQVTQNVYDRATARTLLVPQRARPICSHFSLVAFGQKRALVVWQRLVLPAGS